MNTKYEMDEKMKRDFLELAARMDTTTEVYPYKFHDIMTTNTGMVSSLSWSGKDEFGLERRNPLIVVAGDSVTAGHFEISQHGIKALASKKIEIGKDDRIPKEITDVLESYPERFRRKLIDLYEATSVNVVNAGIAGDTIVGLRDRLERDVISLQPDMVILNCTLNWNESIGDIEYFYIVTRSVVQNIKKKTDADIVILTPNMDAGKKLEQVTGQKDTLKERVEMLRRIAREEHVCLADAYRVWECFAEQGHDVTRMLSNGFNHPTKTGHEVFALELMKLFPMIEKKDEWKKGTQPFLPNEKSF